MARVEQYMTADPDMRAGIQRLQLIQTSSLPEECLDAPPHESVAVEQLR